MEITKFVTFVMHNWYLFLALLVVLGLLAMEPLRRIIYKLQFVSPIEAVNLINRQNALVVDVRDPKDFQAGHIVDALNLPLGELKNRLGDLGKRKGRPIIVVCHNGQTAPKAVVILRKQVVENMFVLAGGIAAWLKGQLPVER